MRSNGGARASDLSPEKLAHDARTRPLFVSAQALAEWVGEGRPVTTRGVLKPGAAVEVCDLLGIEPRSRKPRSAMDIDELMEVWAVASAAGFIEVSRGRVVVGPALWHWVDGTPDKVLAVWRECALVCLGLVDDENGETDLDCLAVLATLAGGGGTASVGALGAAIAQLTSSGSPTCSCPNCASGDGFDGVDEEDARDDVEVMEKLGVAVLTDDVAELTELGLWLTDSVFRQGAPAADVDAWVLVGELTPVPDMVAMLMARPWLSNRTPVAAVRELLAVGASTPGPGRLFAVTLAKECGPAAEPAWREWAAKDGFGAYARAWLAEQQGTEPSETDAAWITVDALTTMLDGVPAEVADDVLRDLLQAQVDPEVLPLFMSTGHPAAPRIVELLTNGQAAPATVASPARRRLALVGSGYQIKVQLRGVTKPPVWRRLRLPADLTLGQLHHVVQTAMGWDDDHLHAFTDERAEYGPPGNGRGLVDEERSGWRRC
ncbi:hypothetical protein GCM10029964_095320 [Kibdelosporangium lantanae]